MLKLVGSKMIRFIQAKNWSMLEKVNPLSAKHDCCFDLDEFHNTPYYTLDNLLHSLHHVFAIRYTDIMKCTITSCCLLEIIGHLIKTDQTIQLSFFWYYSNFTKTKVQVLIKTSETLRALFMIRFQLPQGSIAITRKWFTFEHYHYRRALY